MLSIYQARHLLAKHWAEGRAGQYTVTTARRATHPSIPASRPLQEPLFFERPPTQQEMDGSMGGWMGGVPTAIVGMNDGWVVRFDYRPKTQMRPTPAWEQTWCRRTPLREGEEEEGRRSRVYKMAKEGNLVACAQVDGRVMLLDAETGGRYVHEQEPGKQEAEEQEEDAQQPLVFDTGFRLPTLLNFLEERRYLAVAVWGEQLVKIYDIRTGELCQTIEREEEEEEEDGPPSHLLGVHVAESAQADDDEGCRTPAHLLVVDTKMARFFVKGPRAPSGEDDQTYVPYVEHGRAVYPAHPPWSRAWSSFRGRAVASFSPRGGGTVRLFLSDTKGRLWTCSFLPSHSSVYSSLYPRPLQCLSRKKLSSSSELNGWPCPSGVDGAMLLHVAVHSLHLNERERSYVFRIEEKEEGSEEGRGEEEEEEEDKDEEEDNDEEGEEEVEECVVTHRLELIGREYERRTCPFRVQMGGSRIIHLYRDGSMDVFMLPPSLFLPAPIPPPLSYPTPVAPAYSLVGGSQTLRRRAEEQDEVQQDEVQGDALVLACHDLVLVTGAMGAIRVYDFSA